MKTLLITFLLATLLCLAYTMTNETNDEQPPAYLTSHFQTWLEANGYGQYGFARLDIAGGSFGGKQDDNDTVVREPVIFFHGNGDHAYAKKGSMFGFQNTIEYFMSLGYKESELYATTWGTGKLEDGMYQYHSFNYLNYLRKFVEAVLKYTNASKIDCIGHSMGVTLGRKVIKGGTGTDGQPYDLGESLAPYVDTFLGISGGNYGIIYCIVNFEWPTCDRTNGFFPGFTAKSGPSPFLDNLNKKGGREGDHVFSMYSMIDQGEEIVWGHISSKIPDQDGNKVYYTLDHVGMKLLTYKEQYQIVVNHKV